MHKRFMTITASCGLALAVVAPAATALAVAGDDPIAVGEDGQMVQAEQLSPEQLAAFTNQPVAEGFDVSGEEAGASSVRAAATTRYRKAQYKRGSSLMWTRDTVYFGYNGSKVTSSKGWQESGHVFPNIAKNNGIKRYHTTSSTHKWRAKDTIGAGVPTPWGDVKAYSTDYTHYFSGGKSGAWNWKG
ncbi:hypothetical protein [Streptomyces sp. HSG2]|uniref:hypothetical protein n=1 Tax=Streptomyces sp. HSG2 TaxID=2797167 RepID=UPI0019077CD4|nr:hypothetical protein [Streptomyces sp. HSG2]